MKYILLLIIICVLFSDVYGQYTWQRYFFDKISQGRKSQQTSDSGFITIGNISLTSSDRQIFLLKQKPNGDSLWTKFLGGTKNDYAWWIEETYDKGFIIGGDTDSNGYINSSGVIIKTDKFGNIQWQKIFYNINGSQCTCIKQLSDKGYIITLLWNEEITKTMIIKSDSLGNAIWSNKYSNGSNSAVINEIIVTNDSGYIGVGTSVEAPFQPLNIFILKLKSNGDVQWTKTISSPFNDIAYQIQNTNDNGFIFCGSTNEKSYIVKLDAIGEILWEKIFSSIGRDVSYAIRKIPEGYIVAGSSDTLGVYCSRAKIRIIDENGNIIRQMTYNPSGKCAFFFSAERAYDGGYILSGYTENGAIRVYIVKTDSLLYSTPIGISSATYTIPIKYNLLQNYPNPFNGGTYIEYKIFEKVNVKLIIYDALGREISILINKIYNIGEYIIYFDSMIYNLSSGIYFYRMEFTSLLLNTTYSETKKMLNIK